MKDLVAEYRYIIVDECHHLYAVSIAQVMRQARARYVTGVRKQNPIKTDCNVSGSGFSDALSRRREKACYDRV